MPADAAQIVAVERHTMPVEEIENLDRHLASAFDPVTKLRCGEVTVFRAGRQISDDADHVVHGGTEEEMIMGDFVRPSHPTRELQELPDVALRSSRCRRDVADARRAKPIVTA